MNIFRTAVFRTTAVALALPLFALFLAACDVGSVDSTSSVLSDNSGNFYNFSGLYMHPKIDLNSTNAPPALVYPNTEGRRPSGEVITFLRLLQYGSVLEAYDSAGLTWYGDISSLQDKTASFSLSGRTTVGQAVSIAGTMTYVSDSHESTMDATWIEPSYFGTLSAKATVSPANTNSPTDDVSISPTSATLNTNGAQVVFTANGGNGTYSWTHNSSCGTLSSTTGNPITYTRASSGSDTLTVTSNGKSDSSPISCP